MAKALQLFGMKRALVVHSEGLDEMSPLGEICFSDSIDTHGQIYRSLHLGALYITRILLLSICYAGPGLILDVTPEKIEKFAFDPRNNLLCLC